MQMQVVSFHTGNRIRYMLVDEDGLRYHDNTERARNTWRVTCYRLKLFWQFLRQEGLSNENATLDNLDQYKAWLREGPSKIIAIHRQGDQGSPRTLNVYLDTVLQFYDYLMRHGDYVGNHLLKPRDQYRHRFAGSNHLFSSSVRAGVSARECLNFCANGNHYHKRRMPHYIPNTDPGNRRAPKNLPFHRRCSRCPECRVSRHAPSDARYIRWLPGWVNGRHEAFFEMGRKQIPHGGPNTGLAAIGLAPHRAIRGSGRRLFEYELS